MKKVPMRYIGTRASVVKDIGGYRFVFNSDNNLIADVPERYIAKLMRKGKFMPVVNQPKPVEAEEVVEEVKAEIKVEPVIKKVIAKKPAQKRTVKGK